MCGIVGVFDMASKSEINRSLLHLMNESQIHRGPDEGGLHLEPGLGFGHRRLSIIDLSSGQQPMHSKDGNVVLTYNGEIYNFLELRKELEILGYTFRTDCDTEVIVYAWQAWGEDCVLHLRGMFAFAIWDRNKKTLFLARDRLGIKPLFYSQTNKNHFIFSSELKALKKHPDFSKEIEPTAIEEYFGFGYIPDPKTIYKGTYKLEPGYCLTIRHGDKSFKPRQYWDVSFNNSLKGNETELGNELIERIKEATAIRMVADVPLAAFLSGGVDSSAIVALMAGISSEPVNTCSISFGNPLYNESQFAENVAKRYLTRHHVEQVDPDDYHLISQLSGMYDEPFADSSALPTFRVCQLAKKNATVVLSGDGGDESLAGYKRYRWHMNEDMLRGIMPDNVRKPLFGFLGNIYPSMPWAPKMFRAKSTLESIGRDSLEGYFHSISLQSNQFRNQLFNQELKRELQGYQAVEVLSKHAEKASTDNALSLVQYLDFKTYLPGDILTKVDRASMANSLEVRVPLLDHKLVEWIAKLPPDLKLKGGEGKYLFKKSLEKYLPDNILYRPKMGFAVPLSDWFRGPLKEKVENSLLGETVKSSHLFNDDFIKKIISQHQRGQHDYSSEIWSLLMFEQFLTEEL